MYSSLIGIPVAGATLPVFAFLLLGLYGNSILMILATVILGIGHIGIHLNHYKKSVTEKVNIKKKVLKIISIFIGIIVVHSSASFAYKTYQLNELEKMSSSDMIEYVTKNDDNTKISVAVIKDGKVEYKIYGTNMEEEKQIYDYEIGSISKTYVSLLLSKAVEDNKINMNDSINKYLELDNDKYYPTIERLVTHTSGYNAYYFDPQMIANKFSQDNDFYGIIEQKKNGVWYSSDNEQYFNALAILLESKATNEFEVDFETTLPQGEYRIIKSINVSTGSIPLMVDFKIS